MTARSLSVDTESWPLETAFTISRGTKTKADVVTVTLRQGAATGWGECVPYARYGESLESVVAQIEACRAQLEQGAERAAVQSLMPAGAARNAVDCALWDLDAKLSGRTAWQLAGLEPPAHLTTAYTLSLDTPEKMYESAKSNADRPLLKIKLGGRKDIDRLRAIRSAAPQSALIVDANESWPVEVLEQNIAAMADLGVALIEQPLPAGKDAALARIAHAVPICADESSHHRQGLAELKDRYDVVNIKLDKTGGLTEALAMAREAKNLGFRIMVGCMVGTSLAMAPAMLIGSLAEFVDLDGPLILGKERRPGIAYDRSTMHMAPRDLWG